MYKLPVPDVWFEPIYGQAWISGFGFTGAGYEGDMTLAVDLDDIPNLILQLQHSLKEEESD